MSATRVIGLTGGIASGKSTVATMLRELGAPIVDADRLARDVVARGTPGLTAIVERFGDDILDAEGNLDRKRMGALVFAEAGSHGDAESGARTARAALNAIVHPRIAEASQRAIAAYAASHNVPVVYEAALIVENRITDWLDELIVVAVPEALQLTRLMKRDDLDSAAAQARLAAQLPLSDKIALADYVVDNVGSLEHTREQVATIWRKVCEP